MFSPHVWEADCAYPAVCELRDPKVMELGSTIFTTARAHKYCNVWRCILVNNLRTKSHAGWMHAWDRYWATDDACSRRGDGLFQGHLCDYSGAWSVLALFKDLLGQNKIPVTQSQLFKQNVWNKNLNTLWALKTGDKSCSSEKSGSVLLNWEWGRVCKGICAEFICACS